MNLREGSRRLALLVGGLGAIAGFVASYSYLQPVMRQRELHTEFERLANSDVVSEERKKLQSAPDFIPANPDSIPAGRSPTPISGLPQGAVVERISPKPWEKYAAQSTIPPPPSGRAIDPNTGERIATSTSTPQPNDWQTVEYDAQGKPIPAPAPAPEYDANGKPIPQHGRAKGKYTIADLAPTSGTEVDWGKAVPLWSDVSKGKIKTINWGHDYEVASIETADGETLSPIPAPHAREYLVGVLFPFLGFLIPWGAVRAIGWVSAGFVAPST